MIFWTSMDQFGLNKKNHDFRNVNIHMKHNDNEEGLQILDMLEALGLTQQVNFTTHTKGNILYLVLTEAACDFNITSVNHRQFPSAHCLVIISLTIQN